MFQFTGLLLHNYEFIMQYLCITIGVFPHSEISGSKRTYSSPKHIVVRHVLHQLLVPRHSPCALSNLITINFFNWFFPILLFILIWWDILMSMLSRSIDYHIIKFSKNYTERIISQNQAKCILLVKIRKSLSFSIERRWSIPTFR